MSNWLFLSLLSSAVYTVVNFTDKYILERQIKDYRGMAMYSAIVGLITGIVLWTVSGFPILGIKDGLLVIITGVLFVFGAALYFQVMQSEETSKVIFLGQLMPIFTILMSSLFLKEQLSIKQFIGFMLIMTSVFALVTNIKEILSLKFNKAFWLMTISDVLWAAGTIIFKFVSDTSSFIILSAYEGFGWVTGGLILFLVFPSVRQAFISTTRKLSKVGLTIVFGNEAVYLASKLLIFLAIISGPVALVSAVQGTNIMFGIIYGWILTLIAPKIFGEDISKKGLLKKFAWGGSNVYRFSFNLLIQSTFCGNI
ncbi:MAG: Conserved hypothetical membrane protein, DUF6 family [Candidatus Amesbacteria bacterium GW2011_GWA2_42_12]|uniref:Conserved hypothetical membrane protein, DUF6 family n=1 Tax=Candidatus Amesbacteria bacterium GW2011_GWA2_42_12 TaxID=1618356 RepID=A0A0G1AGJ0_9BACT|nr:MAG: Conserved hypothetical membrane protein, DUF6 family [Candidatus Amesbacteria bacterium GW2011_GWA2_42_12]